MASSCKPQRPCKNTQDKSSSLLNHSLIWLLLRHRLPQWKRYNSHPILGDRDLIFDREGTGSKLFIFQLQPYYPREEGFEAGQRILEREVLWSDELFQVSPSGRASWIKGPSSFGQDGQGTGFILPEWKVAWNSEHIHAPLRQVPWFWPNLLGCTQEPPNRMNGLCWSQYYSHPH